MSKKSTSKKTNPYFVDKFASISPTFKIQFLKFWIVGAAFLLTVNGLPAAFDFLDRMVVFYFVLVLGYEYIVNKIIWWMNTDQNKTLRFLPHQIAPIKGRSILLTAVYLLVIVLLSYFFLESWVSFGMPTIGDLISESTTDPFSFSLVFLLFDYIWMKIRATIRYANLKE